jgi:prepilin-type N-terminal cleavage/methylation domain-containing protein
MKSFGGHSTSCGCRDKDSGFTLVELVVSLFVFGMVMLAVFGLYLSLLNSATIAKRKAVASTLATNQIEYLKSLPYNNLAVTGGSIIASNPIPATKTQTLSGVTYTIVTNVNYVDDAYDGCASYPTQALKQLYCRNYPPPSGAPATDQNPADYKIAHVSVYASNIKLAEVDTEISARVAETASNTGALFAKVLDQNGNPVAGATVQVVNTTLTPQVSVSDSTDSNGMAIFYGLPPDSTGYDYVITASLAGYSTLSTVAPSGSLQPTYPSQQILVQQSSSVTLTIKPQGTDSLLMATTDTNGNPITGVKVYVKGGYKKYTLTSDTQYYYDTLSPSDVRPVSDASGMATLSNLVPGNYIFCGDSGATSCSIGGTTYYLAAAVPYGGSNSLNPITVPIYLASSPPSTTFSYNGHSYLQEVRLMLTTSSSFPRVNSLSPSTADQSSDNLASFAFHINGNNLPCSSNAASCSTSVKLLQGSTFFTASCTGSSAGTGLDCTVNISGASVGIARLVVSAGGNTLTLPGSPLLGGINVVP